jgi:ABC-type branched-subunit amino acid transport system ATPase component
MGRPIHNLNPNKIVSLGISQVPEGRRIFPYLSVMENLDSEGHIWGFNPKSRSSLAFKFSLNLYPFLQIFKATAEFNRMGCRGANRLVLFIEAGKIYFKSFS